MASQSIRSGIPLVYRSRAFKDILRRIERIAPFNMSVLFRGESGVGKNVLAQYLYDVSGRPGPFVSWCVSQTAPTLAHGAIFGAVRGAYTGLDHSVAGVIDKAGSGTLFLDEIDKAGMDLQAALLRLLDDSTYCWLGSTDIRKTAARFLFATNRNLDQLAIDQQFLSDLAHRLRILTIDIPPLRERREDIPPLVHYMAAQSAARIRRPAPKISREAMNLLMNHPWHGNVREVSGATMNLVVSMRGTSVITRGDVERYLQLSPQVRTPNSPIDSNLNTFCDLPLRERKKQDVIKRVLEQVGGSGAEAARTLRISLRTFRNLQRKFLLRRKDRNSSG